MEISLHIAIPKKVALAAKDKQPGQMVYLEYHDIFSRVFRTATVLDRMETCHGVYLALTNFTPADPHLHGMMRQEVKYLFVSTCGAASGFFYSCGITSTTGQQTSQTGKDFCCRVQAMLEKSLQEKAQNTREVRESAFTSYMESL